MQSLKVKLLCIYGNAKLCTNISAYVHKHKCSPVSNCHQVLDV